jgi:hypothetical protein
MSSSTATSNSSTGQRAIKGIDSQGFATGEAVIGAFAIADREA